MIISCEKCNKKFELDDSLVPEKGRLLKCGSCDHAWHYIPNKKIELINETNVEKKIVENDINLKTEEKTKNQENKISTEENLEKKTVPRKNVGILSLLIIIIISIFALLLLIDTFKNPISYFFPNIESYILSLNETLKDIFLFFKDLIK